MTTSIFDFQDYKRYLKAVIESRPKRGRGLRSELAETVGCQVAYLSQVLNGQAHFHLEQAARVNRFFGHSKSESHFFFLLVQYARAGDRDTKKYFQEQLDEEIAKRLIIKNRLGLAQGLTKDDQVTYYSAWYYAATHILVTIPPFQTRQAIVKKLGLGLEKTHAVIDFLLRTGLLQESEDRLTSGETQIHLGNDSKLITRHHANWRLQAMQSLDREERDDLHYSAVASLSASDATKLKAMIVKKIEELVSVIKDSKEEQLNALCVDFFRVN